MTYALELFNPKILLLLLLVIVLAVVFESGDDLKEPTMTGAYWGIYGTAEMPRNDCGLNYHLRLDPGNGLDPCDLGVVAKAIVSQQVQKMNAELDKTDPLPSGVQGRIGLWDEIMHAWDKFFMGIDPFPPE